MCVLIDVVLVISDRSLNVAQVFCLLVIRCVMSLSTSQQEDVVKVHRLLRRCSRHLDLQLEGGCQGLNGCNRVPKECLEHDAVYTILHYLIDAAFLNPEVKKCHLPFAYSSPPLPPFPLFLFLL